MRELSTENRALIGCGYEPPHKLAVPWRHRGATDCGYPEPTICPGYSTKLPEVVEIARARMHWSKGALQVESLSETVQRGVEILEASICEMNDWALRDRSKK